MRNSFFRKLLYLSIILSLSLIPACAVIASGPVADLTPTAAAASPPPGLNIMIDPRIELLAVVQILSNYNQRTGLITRQNFAYKQAVLTTFGQFRSHRAVKIFERMSQKGFSFDAPPAAMLHLTDPPELAVHTSYTEYLLRRAGGEKKLGEFITALRDFAVETDFMRFYSEQQPFYDQITASVTDMLADTDDLTALEAYYGMQEYSYNIVLAPLYHAGGFGPRVTRPDGSADVYSIGGPQSMNEDGFPTFGDSQSFRYLIWHEFAHSFVNPQTTLHRGAVNSYAHLLKPIQKEMKKQAYGDWETVVNEHIVRAITTRLSYRLVGQEAGDAALAYETERSFIYLPLLLEQLERYEADRVSYPTFADFYPELIRAFDSVENKP
jgi:hypothetical protein